MGIDVPNGTHADLQERNDRNDRGVRERAGTPGGKPFLAPPFPSSKGFSEGPTWAAELLQNLLQTRSTAQQDNLIFEMGEVPRSPGNV